MTENRLPPEDKIKLNMPKEEVISVTAKKGQESFARLEMIKQTYNVFLEKAVENPKTAVDVNLYVSDVGFLLNVVLMFLNSKPKEK